MRSKVGSIWAISRSVSMSLMLYIFSSSDIVEPLDPKKKFSKSDYYKNPHLYKSVFAEKVAPYASAIVNGIYWDQNFPRLLTIKQMEKL